MELNIDRIVACILDMDGVVTDTARVHEKAWKRLFDSLLSTRAALENKEFLPFDDADYRRYVDGKPRYDGVESFLASRGIRLPYGDPGDSPAEETICGLGNRKNEYFHQLLETEGAKAFDSTVAFIRRGRAAGLRFALISASRNASRVLTAAGIGELFQAVVDVVGIEELNYAGSHGFEISGGGGYFDRDDRSARYLAALATAEQELRSAARDLQNIRIERKPFAIAIHYRNAEQPAIGAIEHRVDTLVERFGKLHKTSGRKIFELRPAVAWDKGKALQALLERFHLDCSRITPLYIGDDTTDEDAFRSLGEGGIGILVSENPRPTAARYFLRNPSEVTVFLERLVALVERELVRGVWSLTYDGYDPESEKLRETLCTLGNGLFACRGASPQAAAGPEHYPGTYLAGCYNRLRSNIAGQAIENESLVNIPNWLPLTFRLDDGPWCGTETMEFDEYSQELDMASGLLSRSVIFQDRGREIRLTERRVVSMDQPHLAGLETVVFVSNWSGTLIIRSALDGGVANTQVDRYRELNNDYLEVVDANGSEDGQSFFIWLAAMTRQSRIRIAEAARARCYLDEKGVPKTEHRLVREDGYIG